MFAFTFTRNFFPMIIGSLSGCRRFAGITARPRATSDRTNSGSRPSRTATYLISSVKVGRIVLTFTLLLPTPELPGQVRRSAAPVHPAALSAHYGASSRDLQLSPSP
jgi:hypothetical protein